MGFSYEKLIFKKTAYNSNQKKRQFQKTKKKQLIKTNQKRQFEKNKEKKNYKISKSLFYNSFRKISIKIIISHHTAIQVLFLRKGR